MAQTRERWANYNCQTVEAETLVGSVKRGDTDLCQYFWHPTVAASLNSASGGPCDHLSTLPARSHLNKLGHKIEDYTYYDG